MKDIGQTFVQVHCFLVVHMILVILAEFFVQAILALSRVVELAVAGFGVVVAVGFAFSFFLPFFQAVEILPRHFFPVDAAFHSVIGVADVAFILELDECQLVPVVVAVLDCTLPSLFVLEMTLPLSSYS